LQIDVASDATLVCTTCVGFTSREAVSGLTACDGTFCGKCLAQCLNDGDYDPELYASDGGLGAYCSPALTSGAYADDATEPVCRSPK